MIQRNWRPGSGADCRLRTGRTAASGTRFASPLGFWGSFLSTQTYPESPGGSLPRGVSTCSAGWQASRSLYKDFRSPFLETHLLHCVQDIGIGRSNISSEPSENVCFYFDCDFQDPGHVTSTQGL